MTGLTERAAEEHLAVVPSRPGFVGISVDVPADEGSPPGRLRHGFSVERSPGVMTMSGPPSPGLESAIARMSEDLAGAVPDVLGIRVGLETGTGGESLLGMRHRWAVANAAAPVLVAAFANTPAPDGSRRSARRTPGSGPDQDWAGLVLDAPADSSGLTFRQWIRTGGVHPPTIADLDRHRRRLRPPVAARGHLVIDVADGGPGGWQVPAAVIFAVLEDPAAGLEALDATAGLTDPWETAACDALTNAELAAAARRIFAAAYAALARHGLPRPVRDAVGDYCDRYVFRGRCPADDILDELNARP